MKLCIMAVRFDLLDIRIGSIFWGFLKSYLNSQELL